MIKRSCSALETPQILRLPVFFLSLFLYSGAGKTTLMNVLAHRNISQMEVRGTVEVNDRPIGREITKITAYIQQEDLFVGSLTVREHLIFQVSDEVFLF